MPEQLYQVVKGQQDKIKALKAAGIHVVSISSDIGKTVKSVLQG
jgi:succinyl-CoA synthetase alpha subunit